MSQSHQVHGHLYTYTNRLSGTHKRTHPLTKCINRSLTSGEASEVREEYFNGGSKDLLQTLEQQVERQSFGAFCDFYKNHFNVKLCCNLYTSLLLIIISISSNLTVLCHFYFYFTAISFSSKNWIQSTEWLMEFAKLSCNWVVKGNRKIAKS